MIWDSRGPGRQVEVAMAKRMENGAVTEKNISSTPKVSYMVSLMTVNLRLDIFTKDKIKCICTHKTRPMSIA